MRRGGAWAVAGGTLISLTDTGATFDAGWVLGTGTNTPSILREGRRRTLFGNVTHSGTAPLNRVVTLAAADRPPTTAERSIGITAYRPAAGGNGSLFSSLILVNGVIGNKSMSASAPINYTYELAGLSWWMD